MVFVYFQEEVLNNETFEVALKREIYEETRIVNMSVKNCVFSRIEVCYLRNIEDDIFYESYYVVETDDNKIDSDNL